MKTSFVFLLLLAAPLASPAGHIKLPCFLCPWFPPPCAQQTGGDPEPCIQDKVTANNLPATFAYSEAIR